jgi:hypothetical protein
MASRACAGRILVGVRLISLGERQNIERLSTSLSYKVPQVWRRLPVNMTVDARAVVSQLELNVFIRRPCLRFLVFDGECRFHDRRKERSGDEVH